jgi:hypothetical protein
VDLNPHRYRLQPDASAQAIGGDGLAMPVLRPYAWHTFQYRDLRNHGVSPRHAFYHRAHH